MQPQEPDSVIYRSAVAPSLGAGWDVLSVIYARKDGGQMRPTNSFVIARDSSGRIIRSTDPARNRWEVVNDEGTLHEFRHCFDERDRLMREKPEAIQYTDTAQQKPAGY